MTLPAAIDSAWCQAAPRDASFSEAPQVGAPADGSPADACFTDTERASFYRLIAARRDVRHFAPSDGTLPDAQLQRLLEAAHAAPSVGLMQPWRFVRVLDRDLREELAGLVDAERRATAAALDERAAEFLRLKVEGLRECAELLAVVLAPDDGTVFGRRTMPREMALCSLGAAVQNLWLAARVEQLGLGWVSLFEPQAVGDLLGLPDGAQALGLLCLGPTQRFDDRPMLERAGWRQGRPLQALLHIDRWCDEGAEAPPIRPNG